MQMYVCACVMLMVAVVEVSCQAPELPCSPCDNVQCGDPPQNCQLDTIPCGCCPTCARLEGQICESFSPRCGYGLRCLTPGGFYDGRPPWYMQYLRGVCVKAPQTHPDPIHPLTSSPAHSVKSQPLMSHATSAVPIVSADTADTV